MRQSVSWVLTGLDWTGLLLSTLPPSLLLVDLFVVAFQSSILFLFFPDIFSHLVLESKSNSESNQVNHGRTVSE